MNVYDNPITFEQLCEISDTQILDSDIKDDFTKRINSEKVKSPSIQVKSINTIEDEMLERHNIVAAKVKKMSTSQLLRIFREHRSYECNDRQTLIFVVIDILLDNDIKEEIEKQEFVVEVIDLDKLPKLDVYQIREIRRLYNIKYTTSNGKIDSCYSFNEIASLYNLSHIFVRNICLGKVYKSI